MNRTQRGSSHNLPPATPMKKFGFRSIHPGSEINVPNKRVRLFDSSSSSSSSAQSSFISPASSSLLGFQLSPAANSFSNESKRTSQQELKIKESPYNEEFKKDSCAKKKTVDNKRWTYLNEGQMNFVYKSENEELVLKVPKKTWLNLAKYKQEKNHESKEKFAREAREDFLSDKTNFIKKLIKAGFTINNGDIRGTYWVEPFVRDSLCCKFISNNKENINASNVQASSSQSSQINTQSEPNEDSCKQHGFKMFELFFKSSDQFVEYDKERHEVKVSIPDIKPDNVTSGGVFIDLDPIPMQDEDISEINVNLIKLIKAWNFNDKEKDSLINKIEPFINGIKAQYKGTD